MIQHKDSISVNCPVERVFAFVTDAANLRTWQSNLIENELLTAGPLGNGSRFREVRRVGGKPTEVRGEVTDFVPGKLFATRTLGAPDVKVSYAFEAQAGGARLTYTFIMRTRGLMRLMEPLIARSIKKESRLDLENLKRILES